MLLMMISSGHMRICFSTARATWSSRIQLQGMNGVRSPSLLPHIGTSPHIARQVGMFELVYTRTVGLVLMFQDLGTDSP